jgi:integrase
VKNKTVAFCAAAWLAEIEDRYGRATFEMYERLVRLYLIPGIGASPISNLNPQIVKRYLETVTDKGMSRNVRHKVKVTLSLICQREMEQDAPVIYSNPTLGIKFKEKRKSEKKKLPSIIRTAKGVERFLHIAQDTGLIEWANSEMGLNGGLRKGEKIARKWKDFDFEQKFVKVDSRYEQASGTILPGTKNDENAYRLVPMSDDFCTAMEAIRALTPFATPEDFVLCVRRGQTIEPKLLHNLHTKVALKAGEAITDHEMRHTFGAHFIASGGNVRALKDILGHETLAQTDKYTQLSQLVLMTTRNVVRYRKAEK